MFKIMKRSLLILVSLFAFSALFAQTAQLKVGYDYYFFDPRGIEKHHDFILLSGRDCSNSIIISHNGLIPCVVQKTVRNGIISKDLL